MDKQTLRSQLVESKFAEQDEARVAQITALVQQDEARVAQINALVQQDEARVAHITALAQQDEVRVAQINALVQQDEVRVAQINAFIQQDVVHVAQITALRQQDEVRVNQITALLQQDEARVAQITALLQQDKERVAQITARVQHDAERVAQITARVQQDEERIAQITDLLHKDSLRVSKMTDMQKMDESRVHQLFQMNERLQEGQGLDVESSQKPLVIAHTLPKTGSQTMVKSLGNPAFNLRVRHGHCLSQKGIAQLLEYSNRTLSALNKRTHLEIAKQSLTTLQYIDAARTTKLQNTIYFLCGVRDPIALALSLIFHVAYVSDDPKNHPIPNNQEQIVDELIRLYSDTDTENSYYIPIPRIWLAQEMASFHDVDPIADGFDIGQGFQIYDGKYGSVLIYRQEDINRVFDQSLKALLGDLVPNIGKTDTNKAADKDYGDAYQNLISGLKIPESLLDRIYADPYATTFYSPNEREVFKNRWRG